MAATGAGAIVEAMWSEDEEDDTGSDTNSGVTYQGMRSRAASRWSDAARRAAPRDEASMAKVAEEAMQLELLLKARNTFSNGSGPRTLPSSTVKLPK